MVRQAIALSLKSIDGTQVFPNINGQGQGCTGSKKMQASLPPVGPGAYARVLLPALPHIMNKPHVVVKLSRFHSSGGSGIKVQY